MTSVVWNGRPVVAPNARLSDQKTMGTRWTDSWAPPWSP